MDNELFELCKEVYIQHPEHQDWQGEWIIITDKKELKVYKDSENEEYGAFNFYSPLYTSDYLLEKLPNPSVHKLTDNWRAFGGEQDTVATATADTPLKALLKLTKALAEAGELKA